MSDFEPKKVMLRFYSDIPDHVEIREFLDSLPTDGRGIRNLQSILEAPILALAREHNRQREAPEAEELPVNTLPTTNQITPAAEERPIEKLQDYEGSLLQDTLNNCQFG